MPEEDGSENYENASEDAKTENESYNNSVNTSKSNSLEIQPLVNKGSTKRKASPEMLCKTQTLIKTNFKIRN